MISQTLSVGTKLGTKAADMTRGLNVFGLYMLQGVGLDLRGIVTLIASPQVTRHI